MSHHYVGPVLRIDGRTAVALRFCESMRFPDGESLVVDILKDDLHIHMIMTSGTEHTVSIAALQKVESRFADIDKKALRESIYNKWIHILGTT